MDSGATERIACVCEETTDAAGRPVLIPSRDCDLHWHHVIDADPPPPHLYP
jgi:hypothetical protein